MANPVGKIYNGAKKAVKFFTSFIGQIVFFGLSIVVLALVAYVIFNVIAKDIAKLLFAEGAGQTEIGAEYDPMKSLTESGYDAVINAEELAEYYGFEYAVLMDAMRFMEDTGVRDLEVVNISPVDCNKINRVQWAWLAAVQFQYMDDDQALKNAGFLNEDGTRVDGGATMTVEGENIDPSALDYGEGATLNTEETTPTDFESLFTTGFSKEAGKGKLFYKAVEHEYTGEVALIPYLGVTRKWLDYNYFLEDKLFTASGEDDLNWSNFARKHRYEINTSFDPNGADLNAGFWYIYNYIWALKIVKELNAYNVSAYPDGYETAIGQHPDKELNALGNGEVAELEAVHPLDRDPNFDPENDDREAAREKENQGKKPESNQNKNPNNGNGTQVLDGKGNPMEPLNPDEVHPKAKVDLYKDYVETLYYSVKDKGTRNYRIPLRVLLDRFLPNATLMESWRHLTDEESEGDFDIVQEIQEIYSKACLEDETGGETPAQMSNTRTFAVFESDVIESNLFRSWRECVEDRYVVTDAFEGIYFGEEDDDIKGIDVEINYVWYDKSGNAYHEDDENFNHNHDDWDAIKAATGGNDEDIYNVDYLKAVSMLLMLGLEDLSVPQQIDEILELPYGYWAHTGNTFSDNEWLDANGNPMVVTGDGMVIDENSGRNGHVASHGQVNGSTNHCDYAEEFAGTTQGPWDPNGTIQYDQTSKLQSSNTGSVGGTIYDPNNYLPHLGEVYGKGSLGVYIYPESEYGRDYPELLPIQNAMLTSMGGQTTEALRHYVSLKEVGYNMPEEWIEEKEECLHKNRLKEYLEMCISQYARRTASSKGWSVSSITVNTDNIKPKYNAVYSVKKIRVAIKQSVYAMSMPFYVVKATKMWSGEKEFFNTAVVSGTFDNPENEHYIIHCNVYAQGYVDYMCKMKVNWRCQLFAPVFAGNDEAKTDARETDVLVLISEWEEAADNGITAADYFVRDIRALLNYSKGVETDEGSVGPVGDYVDPDSYEYLYIKDEIVEFDETMAEQIFWLNRLFASVGDDAIDESTENVMKSRLRTRTWQIVDYDLYDECKDGGTTAAVYALWPYGSQYSRTLYVIAANAWERENHKIFAEEQAGWGGYCMAHEANDLYGRRLSAEICETAFMGGRTASIKSKYSNGKVTLSGTSSTGGLGLYFDDVGVDLILGGNTYHFNGTQAAVYGYHLYVRTAALKNAKKAEAEIWEELNEEVTWTEIRAVAPGIVTSSGAGTSAGFKVAIVHGDGSRTFYCHMKRHPEVQEGEYVGAGAFLGYEGTTGRSGCYHLHIEYGGKNPIRYLYPFFTPFYYEEKAVEANMDHSSEYMAVERTVFPYIQVADDHGTPGGKGVDFNGRSVAIKNYVPTEALMGSTSSMVTKEDPRYVDYSQLPVDGVGIDLEGEDFEPILVTSPEYFDEDYIRAVLARSGDMYKSGDTILGVNIKPEYMN